MWRYKVNVKAMGRSRWIVLNELPTGMQFEEWLLLGKDGIPIMYWSASLRGVMLI